MYINLLLLAIFAGCVACLATGGLWSNFIMLVNVITAALLAVNYFEPLAGWLQGIDSSFMYVFDFVALWGIFGVSVGLLRAGHRCLVPGQGKV